MPRGKKRDSISSSNSKSSNKKRRTASPGFDCDVKDVLGCRISPKSEKEMEFYVSWSGFDNDHNSYEPYDNLRMNLELSKFIDKAFEEKELAIYVTIANIKQRIKGKIRKSLARKKKMEIMFEVQPFDPKEYRTTLAFYHLIDDPPQSFTDHLEDFIYRSYFFEMEKSQRIKHDKIIEGIMEIDDGFKFTIENDEDFDLLPEFNYIKKNFLADEVNTTIIESPTKSSSPRGCSCEEKCSRKSSCCPKIVNAPFPYKKDGKDNYMLNLKHMENIYECGDKCKCGPECINRVSQRTSTTSLCLFKTLNGRGWGLKTTKKIKEGTYITEYRGELLGHHEAGKRAEARYLFDLNMERLSNGYYTLDAFKFGSIARFVNHSCEANSKMWFINDCNCDPKSQKLCIFADRDIEPDEEITIDYSPKDSVPIEMNSSLNASMFIECACGTSSCRGKIY